MFSGSADSPLIFLEVWFRREDRRGIVNWGLFIVVEDHLLPTCLRFGDVFVLVYDERIFDFEDFDYDWLDYCFWIMPLLFYKWCISMWRSRSSWSVNWSWQWLQINFSCDLGAPWCRFMCSFRVLYLIKVWLHISHSKGRVLVCFRLWSIRWPWVVKLFPQPLNSHLKGFSPVCIRMCVLRFPFSVKQVPQTSHLNGFSPVCVLLWILSLPDRA